MKCTNCGKENPEGTKFCGECGSRIIVPAAPQAPAAGETPKPVFCAKCGASLAPEQKFCPKCGARVNTDPVAATVAAGAATAAGMTAAAVTSAANGPAPAQVDIPRSNGETVSIWEPKAQETPAPQPAPAPQSAPEPAPQPAPQQPAETGKPAFCAGCGAPIEPGLKFCPKCGTPAGTAQKPKAKKKIDKKWFIIGGCAVVAIAVAVVLIVVLTGGKGGVSSPEDFATAFWDAYSDGDYDDCLDLCTTQFLREAAREVRLGVDSNASRSELIDKGAEMAEYILSMIDIKLYSIDNVSIDYSWDGSSRISWMGYSESEINSIQDYARITAYLSFRVNGKSDTERVRIGVVKMDGRWYAFDIDD